MHKDRYIFSQIVDLIPRYELDKCIQKYSGNKRIKSLGCRDQFLSLCFGQLASHKQFTAFLGLDPRTHQSGTSINGKGYITKRGNTLLRTLVYNCTSVAIQRPNIFQRCYQHKVSEGKPKMVALVATMHKMTRVIHAVWSKNTPFIDQTNKEH